MIHAGLARGFDNYVPKKNEIGESEEEAWDVDEESVLRIFYPAPGSATIPKESQIQACHYDRDGDGPAQ